LVLLAASTVWSLLVGARFWAEALILQKEGGKEGREEGKYNLVSKEREKLQPAGCAARNCLGVSGGKRQTSELDTLPSNLPESEKRNWNLRRPLPERSQRPPVESVAEKSPSSAKLVCVATRIPGCAP
jgi:hypothetical protein